MKLHNDELIKKWEELRLEAYLPTPQDVWTIGWGHTHTTKKGQTITKEEAQKLFDDDVKWATDAVNKHVKVGLTQNQFDALVSFVFNIGEGGFSRSTTLKRLNAGNYEGAAEAMTWWNKQDGKILRGLVRRRAEEKEYFLSDVIEEAPEKSLTPQEEDGFKSLLKSKEVWGGLSAVLTGVGATLGSLVPGAQIMIAAAVSVLLIAFGFFFIYNRMKARNKGER